MYYGEIPKSFIDTTKSAMLNQSFCESVMGAFGSKTGGAAKQQSNTADDGSSFWVIALILVILTTVVSLFTGSPSDDNKAAAQQAVPGEGHDSNSRN